MMASKSVEEGTVNLLLALESLRTSARSHNITLSIWCYFVWVFLFYLQGEKKKTRVKKTFSLFCVLVFNFSIL
jgi:hypothetical protein